MRRGSVLEKAGYNGTDKLLGYSEFLRIAAFIESNSGDTAETAGIFFAHSAYSSSGNGHWTPKKMSNASRVINAPRQRMRRNWALSNTILLALVVVVAVLLVLNLLLLRPVTTIKSDQSVSPTLPTPDTDSDNY